MAAWELTKRWWPKLLLLATLVSAALTFAQNPGSDHHDTGALLATALLLLIATACVRVALRDSREGRIISWAFCIGLSTIAILTAAAMFRATNPKCGTDVLNFMIFGIVLIVCLITLYVGTRLVRRIGLGLQSYLTA
jgi:uncharacterized membrane protein